MATIGIFQPNPRSSKVEISQSNPTGSLRHWQWENIAHQAERRGWSKMGKTHPRWRTAAMWLIH